MNALKKIGYHLEHQENKKTDEEYGLLIYTKGDFHIIREPNGTWYKVDRDGLIPLDEDELLAIAEVIKEKDIKK